MTDHEADAARDGYLSIPVRPHDRPNLFARLPRGVVRRLRRLATASTPADDDDADGDVEDTEFLVLEVKREDGSSAYLSFNGGFLDDAEDDWDGGRSNNGRLGYIEMPRSFIEACQLPDRVLVRSLPLQLGLHNRDFPTVATAAALTLEAQSRDDYELLSRHADRLQGGGLLRQVSVVYPRQRLTLHLPSNGGGGVNDDCRGNARTVQLRVQAPDGRDTAAESDGALSESSERRHTKSIWRGVETASEETDQLSIHPLENERHASEERAPWHCWRLVADTEVTILPPLESALSPKRIRCRLYPSQADYPCVPSSELPPDVSLGCVLMHPKQLQALPPAGSPASSGRSQSSTYYVRITKMHAATSTTAPRQAVAGTKSSLRIFQVECSESVPEGWIALCRLSRLELDLSLAKDWVQVELVPHQDVLHLCAAARYVGLRLEGVTVHHQQTLATWRYPDGYRSCHADAQGFEHENRNSILVDQSMLAKIPRDLRVIPMGSLLSLPWNHDASPVEATDILYRVITEDSATQGAMSPNDSTYVFANDIGRLLNKTNPQQSAPTSILVKLNEPVTFHDRFSLSRALQGRKLYCTALLNTLTMLSDSVLICGASRSGKTTAASIVSAQLSIERYTVYMDCRRLRESDGVKLSTIMSELESLFTDAALCDKSLVILDNLDEILPVYGGSSQETGSSHSVPQNFAVKDECLAIESMLCHLISTFDGELALVVTCDDPTAVSNSFLSFISFDCSISLPLLDVNERTELFLDLLSIHDPKTRTEFHNSWLEFSRLTNGFRPGDLERLAARVKLNINENRVKSDWNLVAATSQVLDQYVPLSKLSVTSDDSHGDYGWHDIGGLFEVKGELTSIILKPYLYKRIYEKAQIRLPRGILLFGPSGTGKTYLVPALAKECGFPLIICRGPELLSKYIGASESKVRELFNRAASVAPAILFLDELDALAPRRGTDSTGVTDRVVNQLLTFLDGVEDTGSSAGTVYIIASSSRPDKIDPALLRPGRLERHIYVGNPETHEEWTDLILQIARQYDVDDSVVAHISSGGFIHDLSLEAPHAFRFTAADINAVFHTAQVAAAHEAVALGRDTGRAPLRLEHIVDAFQSTRPTLSMDSWQRLQTIYESFRGNRSERKTRGPSQGPLKIALK